MVVPGRQGRVKVSGAARRRTAGVTRARHERDAGINNRMVAAARRVRKRLDTIIPPYLST
ncbi:hypothetical protein JYU34_004612 [Plutella xylostella]|uniref:Uncharacterized protein n=1 Tax=Plutella xylostella TaxID=51655 RepID=A0ABQ7QYD9_PLUXY|nr:hypothetical protein JYU34_004612 [Plutella xylostella]